MALELHDAPLFSISDTLAAGGAKSNKFLYYMQKHQISPSAHKKRRGHDPFSNDDNCAISLNFDLLAHC